MEAGPAAATCNDASLRSARGVDGGNDDGSVVLQIEQINPVDGVAGYVRTVLCPAWSLSLALCGGLDVRASARARRLSALI